MANDEKFDAFFLSIAQQHQGIENLLDSFFGFLGRKTDFFTHHDDASVAELTALKILKKHSSEARVVKEQKKAEENRRRFEEEVKKKEKAKEEERRKQEEEKKKAEEPQLGIVEVNDEEMPEPKKTETKPETVETPVEETEETGETKQKPNEGNGGTTKYYVWTQTLKDVDLQIKIPEGTRGNRLVVDIQKKKLTVGLKGEEPIFSGSLYAAVNGDESWWSVEDQKLLLITLEKINKMEWWQYVVEGHPAIDTQKVQPENSKLSDLDGETRGTVEKMMFDSQQKARGLPTSEEQQKQDLLNKFMAAHPEMDFSNAKIG